MDLKPVWAEAALLSHQYSERPLPALLEAATELRRQAHGDRVSYSRKVFIPLTHLCRDTCRYCTFAETPRQSPKLYLSPDEVVEIARRGREAGCKEALFTLGDKPELRYREAAEHLRKLGYASTVDYLHAVCALVIRETGLLPHINAGIMTGAEIARLREVSISQGIMLETLSDRLSERGGPHFGSPDKVPAVRIAMIEEAGREKVPFTSGVLVGIGETREERIASLLALRNLHARHGHLQEVIVQNFRAKADTKMAASEEPDLEELLWTAAAARLILGAEMNIQVPPNLSYTEFPRLLDAGINDWGGISPVTPDFVNPEAPWPAIVRLEAATAAKGYRLVERLAAYPAYARRAAVWQTPAMATALLAASDAEGYAREDDWSPGLSGVSPPPSRLSPQRGIARELDGILRRAESGRRLEEREIVRLFDARGGEVEAVRMAADTLRQQVSGDTVRYVVNRNINYTNICYYKCRFCAFSKGKTHDHLRGTPYDLSQEEVMRRVREAWERGATEVCMQGGIHPDYTGQTYLDLLKMVKEAASEIHVHAFSALEVHQGAKTLDIPVERFLGQLQDHGLGTLPGTAAEILDDGVRARLCPDKIGTDRWLEIISTAHRRGLRTTATIMFGHIEDTGAWARHILCIRDLQADTGGFTEFVPLPFIHFEAPLYLKGQARRGPTWRETILMYAVSRLALHPLIPNIQGSWVKLGSEGVAASLKAGANDLGGTLMDESISRAAGAEHGSEMPPDAMERLIESCGRRPEQRTTLYQPVGGERRDASFSAAPLTAVIQTPYRPQKAVAGR
jgi:FO synthase